MSYSIFVLLACSGSYFHIVDSKQEIHIIPVLSWGLLDNYDHIKTCCDVLFCISGVMGVFVSCTRNNYVGDIPDYDDDDDDCSDDDYVERITHITADIHERVRRKVIWYRYLSNVNAFH